MRILVTGGAGYIGSHVCVELLQRGHELLIYDNLCNSRGDVTEAITAITHKPAPLVVGDVRDSGALMECMRQFVPEAIIHFAALKSVGESLEHPLSYYASNIGGTVNLLQCMAQLGCKKLVFSSSANVYGVPERCPVKEDAARSTSTPYGRTKLFGEHIILDARAADPDLKAINLRYFNPAGAHPSALIGERPVGKPSNLVPFVAQVAHGWHPSVKVFGHDYPTPDGTGVRDFIHVCDLAEAHVQALEHIDAITDLDAINLGTGRGYSVLEIIRAFETASGQSIPFDLVDRRPGDIPESWADPSLAEERMGWKAKRDLMAMCKDAWRWQQTLQKPLAGA
ncbi:UDP-glucose 4-epimerase GalE [Xanthomonas sacchari]|uniref:UDP-glucose 4-epimerase n=1 Tax=Xanthomonas sacchari TaxID=56458 RepID=A0ABT3DX35_9XANT|nr:MULTISPECIES: UDP-glucose 4-epimerase GalE [Xanthomonas]KAA8920813.1 UDP-glucose 4-epimerase GalE [Xanthomonas sontii]MCW0372360.1 UDP-glucose 4-epimerase [Xanthomonas sacchari]MCW0378491.1 UDP-glucose 4-epimerase [Xanthomonas sacchari]MCW0399550.1 UDP-glucose 4-epimerase [Xanthomonas sacchari]MCW0413436.1 UDP-glucose 4-epimerase [Xanthomonas sacchari]